tara:strand:+ start:4483 stop:4701 length:219 start_codon:yes stop_codon:yes gene_type:complete
MNIEIKNTDVVYVTIHNKTVYIDYSTNDLFIDCWDETGQNTEPVIGFEPDFDLNLPEDKPNLTLVDKDEKDD